MSSPPPSCRTRWPSPGPRRRTCWTWRMILRSSCPGPGRRSGPGCCASPRRGSSPGPARILGPEEARAAEALVLGRAGTLTPRGLQSAIARAVMQVAPDKARERREKAGRDARVERWQEDSGNAALMGRELPPAEVLAADQKISWWARQLRKAGLAGGMDELRARAYLDILLGKDSRPAAPAAGDQDGGGPGGGGPDGGGPDGGGPDGGGSGPPEPGGPG